jgi:hypothetical protein
LQQSYTEQVGNNKLPYRVQQKARNYLWLVPLRLRLVVVGNNCYLAINHIQVAVLQHLVLPPYGEQLWSTS